MIFGQISKAVTTKLDIFVRTSVYSALEPFVRSSTRLSVLVIICTLKSLEHCIADIRLWMTQNLLKSNDDLNKSIWLHHITLNP